MKKLLDTNVRFFTSDNSNINVEMTDTPSDWGDMVKFLDDCLVNGSTPQSVLSLTVKDDEEYWTVTLSVAEGHGVKQYQVITLSGSTNEVLNKPFRVQSVYKNTITIALDKVKVPEKPVEEAPGNLNYYMPSLGLTLEDSEGNKRIYSTNNPDGRKGYIRVDNDCPEGYEPISWAKFSRVTIYSDIENISDIQHRPGRVKAPFVPEDPLRAESQTGTGIDGVYGWSKWYHGLRGSGSYWDELEGNSQRNQLHWTVIGDSRGFYFFVRNANNFNSGYFFGEYIDNYYPNNTFNYLLCAHHRYHYVKHRKGYYGSEPGRVEEGNTFGRAADTSGRYVLNPKPLDYFQSASLSARFLSLVKNTGRDTYSNFTGNLTFVPVYLNVMVPESAYTAGPMRGLHFIGEDLQDLPAYVPRSGTVIEKSSEENCLRFYLQHITLSWGSGGEWRYWQNSLVAFPLNDWD